MLQKTKYVLFAITALTSIETFAFQWAVKSTDSSIVIDIQPGRDGSSASIVKLGNEGNQVLIDGRISENDGDFVINRPEGSACGNVSVLRIHNSELKRETYQVDLYNSGSAAKDPNLCPENALIVGEYVLTGTGE